MFSGVPLQSGPGRADSSGMSPRRRWCARVLGLVTIGLVPVIVTDDVPEGWGLVWLLACCAAALLQPGPATEPGRAAEDGSRPEVRWIRAADIDECTRTDRDYTRMGTSA